MSVIIQTENLTHVYGSGTPFEKTALDHVSIAINEGEFLGLIGHTGSGKSTLIQHLNGLLKPTSGRVLFNGEDIWSSAVSIRTVRFKVGLVFQYPEYQLFEETVYKDIAFGPTNMGLSPAEIDERVREAARFVGIPDATLDKSPFELSGGQKRRAAIAGVISMRPDVLILDEPTAGLDPAGREDILGHIREYHSSRRSTVVLVSHSMEDISRYTERIIVMDKAAPKFDGTPAEIFAKSRELTEIGLDVPMVTTVFMRLKELGLPIDASVYTIDYGIKKLLELDGAANA